MPANWSFSKVSIDLSLCISARQIIRVLILMLKAFGRIGASTYVESRKLVAIAIEGFVVELNKLFYGRVMSCVPGSHRSKENTYEQSPRNLHSSLLAQIHKTPPQPPR